MSYIYHFCNYCLKYEKVSSNWSLYNLSHTHYPGKDIPQKGWVNVGSMSASLQRFETWKDLNKHRRKMLKRKQG